MDTDFYEYLTPPDPEIKVIKALSETQDDHSSDFTIDQGDKLNISAVSASNHSKYQLKMKSTFPMKR